MSFRETAKCLDYRRCGKQRVEAWQILNTLLNDGGWRNHPAVKQWKGFEPLLCVYGIYMCREWISRGYNDSLLPKFEEMRTNLGKVSIPWWLGDNRYHRSHQSNLLRKDPVHYGQFHWDIGPNLEYFWPSKEKENKKCVVAVEQVVELELI